MSEANWKIEELPESLKDAAHDAEKYKALKAVMDQEGGRILVDSLMEDVAGSVNRLASGYKDMAEVEMRAICAFLQVNLGIVAVLRGAKGNVEEINAYIKEKLGGKS